MTPQNYYWGIIRIYFKICFQLMTLNCSQLLKFKFPPLYGAKASLRLCFLSKLLPPLRALDTGPCRAPPRPPSRFSQRFSDAQGAFAHNYRPLTGAHPRQNLCLDSPFGSEYLSPVWWRTMDSNPSAPPPQVLTASGPGYVLFFPVSGPDRKALPVDVVSLLRRTIFSFAL